MTLSRHFLRSEKTLDAGASIKAAWIMLHILGFFGSPLPLVVILSSIYHYFYHICVGLGSHLGPFKPLLFSFSPAHAAASIRFVFLTAHIFWLSDYPLFL